MNFIRNLNDGEDQTTNIDINLEGFIFALFTSSDIVLIHKSVAPKHETMVTGKQVLLLIC